MRLPFVITCGLAAFTLFPLIAASQQGTGPDAETAVISSPGVLPETSAPENTVRIKVEWERPGRTVPNGAYSVAVFSGFDPLVAGKAAYADSLTYLGSGVLRYHHAGIIGDSGTTPMGWLDHRTRKWDAAKIKAALDPVAAIPGERVISISEWPKWMDEDGDHLLVPVHVEDFATLCAELVQIINVNQRRSYAFEITNERDGPYWIQPLKKKEPVRVEELAGIYNQCAKAMRKVDPKVKLGGPAATRPDMLAQLKQFIQLTREHLDFLSVHMYASGSLSDADSALYDKAEHMGRLVKDLEAMLQECSPDKPPELHVNEFNISWTWKTREPRMINQKGAVFDALALAAMARSGVTAASAWNERDNIYGKMDDNFKLRPAAHVFHILNREMRGRVCPATSSAPLRVTAFATSSEQGRALMLVNRSDEPAQIVLDHNLENATRIELTDGNLREPAAGSGRTEMLAPHSVVWILAKG